MTDAHCHVPGDASRHILCSPFGGTPGPADIVFRGIHPWETLSSDDPADTRDPFVPAAGEPVLPAGVGEIGLDRLRERDIPPLMRAVFAKQLAFAAEHRLPVVLHGAKCWGEVVKACEPYRGVIPAFLFHGFSRSDGLLPAIAALNGFISVGPAVLNDHAVNYRALVKKIPSDRLLVETDRTPENAATVPPLAAIAAKVADLRGMPFSEFAPTIERNADRFLGGNGLVGSRRGTSRATD